MINWSNVETDAPDLAARVRSRFEAHGLGYLATLRRDGAPRISGIEPLFAGGEVWLGMMWNSLKALDLQRDPRCELHSANTDKSVEMGDARIAATAVEHRSDSAIATARDLFEEHTGQRPPEGPMHLFSLDMAAVVFVYPENDRLVIESWRAGAGLARTERT